MGAHLKPCFIVESDSDSLFHSVAHRSKFFGKALNHNTSRHATKKNLPYMSHLDLKAHAEKLKMTYTCHLKKC